MQPTSTSSHDTGSRRLWPIAAVGMLVLAAIVGFAIQVGAQAGPDTDGDLIPDDVDNCIEVPNGAGGPCPSQSDVDQDGYGDVCDADFNNNGVDDINDCGAVAAAFGVSAGEPGWNPEHDFNCNGIVDINDMGIAYGRFNQAVGPSGLSCAGTVPCP